MNPAKLPHQLLSFLLLITVISLVLAQGDAWKSALKQLFENLFGTTHYLIYPAVLTLIALIAFTISYYTGLGFKALKGIL